MIHWGGYIVVARYSRVQRGGAEKEAEGTCEGICTFYVRGATGGWCPPECKDMYLCLLEITETLMEFLD